MAADTDLLAGLAQDLHDAGAGTYRPTGAYQPSETAIVFGAMPDSPNRVICLATYGPSDDHPEVALGVRRVQVRTRGLPGNYLDAVNLDNTCFDALHGLEHRQYGTAHANQILRLSGGPLGQDATKRWEMSSNYQVDLDTPPTALRPQ